VKSSSVNFHVSRIPETSKRHRDQRSGVRDRRSDVRYQRRETGAFPPRGNFHVLIILKTSNEEKLPFNC
jgi:hypothetical protein